MSQLICKMCRRLMPANSAGCSTVMCNGTLVEHQCGGPREACERRNCEQCGHRYPTEEVVVEPRRSPEQIAVDTLKCAIAWEPGVRLIGNVKAIEIAELAARQINTCPKCGSTAWVNIDCDLCTMCHALKARGS